MTNKKYYDYIGNWSVNCWDHTNKKKFTNQFCMITIHLKKIPIVCPFSKIEILLSKNDFGLLKKYSHTKKH